MEPGHGSQKPDAILNIPGDARRAIGDPAADRPADKRDRRPRRTVFREHADAGVLTGRRSCADIVGAAWHSSARVEVQPGRRRSLTPPNPTSGKDCHVPPRWQRGVRPGRDDQGSRGKRGLRCAPRQLLVQPQPSKILSVPRRPPRLRQSTAPHLLTEFHDGVRAQDGPTARRRRRRRRHPHQAAARTPQRAARPCREPGAPPELALPSAPPARAAAKRSRGGRKAALDVRR